MRERKGASAGTVHVVRMDMTGVEAAALDALLPRVPAEVRERVLDQVWLRTVLIEQRRRTNLAERVVFDGRADRLLELLDPRDDDEEFRRADAARQHLYDALAGLLILARGNPLALERIHGALDTSRLIAAGVEGAASTTPEIS